MLEPKRIDAVARGYALVVKEPEAADFRNRTTGTAAENVLQQRPRFVPFLLKEPFIGIEVVVAMRPVEIPMKVFGAGLGYEARGAAPLLPCVAS